MEIVVESHALEAISPGVFQDFEVVGTVQTHFAHVRRVPSLHSKERRDSPRETLIEQDPHHATRFSSTVSSSTVAAA